MDFVLPRWLAKAIAVFVEWGNVRLIIGKRLDLCRIDIVIALGGISSAGWYGYYYGWLGAVEATALYVAYVALALVLRPQR